MFGSKLKALRLAAKLTQDELSATSGVSQAAISQIERGEYDPRWSDAIKLAAALRVTPNDFIGLPLSPTPLPPRKGLKRKGVDGNGH